MFLETRADGWCSSLPLAAAALLFAMPSVQARFSEATAEQVGVWRKRQWERAIEVASPSRLMTIGAGLGAVDVELGEFTHNEYVRLLVETGAIDWQPTYCCKGTIRCWLGTGIDPRRSPFKRDLMFAFLMTLISRAVIAAADNVIVFPVLEWYFWGLPASSS